MSNIQLFGMLHTSTPQYNKDVILNSLCVPDGVVRVVFAKRMAIDLQDTNDVVHYGALSSQEDYFQESRKVVQTQPPLYIGDQWTVQYARSPTLSGIMNGLMTGSTWRTPQFADGEYFLSILVFNLIPHLNGAAITVLLVTPA